MTTRPYPYVAHKARRNPYAGPAASVLAPALADLTAAIDRLRATVAGIPPELRDDAAGMIDGLTLETLERR
jgi:hypothetical protein